MNHVYRLIWREAAGGFVAVSEMARACGARTAGKAALVSSALLLVLGAQAAGTGFNVVDGSATLATSGATTTITQTSHGVRIDWQTLGVAAGEILKFVQPSASAVALNVIKGGVATEILGQLQATGNVFILNPNGVLVKAGAQVSVGGFLGSTNDLVSFNPATGALVLQANNSTAEVSNAGSIVATQGGMVALVGNKVINAGTIVAPGGGIYLLAGDRVEFTPADGSPFTYRLTADTTRAKSVSNTFKGSLSAAGGAIVMDARSTKQAVVNSRGVISAGSVSQGPDGSIRLIALGGKGEITNTGKLSAGTAGSISAQLDTGGRLVHAVGDPNNGGTSPVIDQWLSAQDKTYDGNTDANVSVNLQAFGQADFFVDFTLTQASFTSRNATEQGTVLIAGKLVQPDGGQVLLPKSLTAAIHQAELTVTSSDVSKTYDGTTSALGSAVVLSGLVQGDSVSGGSFAFTDKNAGTGKTVTVGGVAVNDGNNGGNYKVTYVDNTTSNIDQAQLTITSSSVSKTYDGTTSAAGSAVASGLMQGDSVSGGSFAFTNKNAGTGKTVTVGGVAVNDGNNGGNYQVTYVDNTTSNIEQAQLTITSSSVSKTYDGTTSAAGSAVASGLMQGDSVSGGSFAFTDKNAGTGKTVTVGGVAVNDGNNGGNYQVTYVDNTTSNIDRAQLTLSAVSDTKPFDNTTNSTGVPQVSGLVANDSVASLSQAFNSSAPGARTLSVNGYVLNDGNGGNNYEVTLVTASGTITSPPPDLSSVINNGGNVPTQLNVDLAGLGDLLAQLPPTAAGEEDDPEKIKARRRSDRSPLRVTDGGVKTPPTLR
jgi:filamentous hemagglutinin family protein